MPREFDYKGFERRYRAAIKPKETLRYSHEIFYSDIAPSELMIIGHNPGGSPSDDGKEKEIEAAKYGKGNGDHAYCTEDYRLAQVMRRYLFTLFELDRSDISSVPKINICARRSENESTFKKWHGVNLWDAAESEVPLVAELISFVDPKFVIFEGHAAWNKFLYFHCEHEGLLAHRLEPPLRRSAGRGTIFWADILRVKPIHLAKPITALVLAHPSQFADYDRIEKVKPWIDHHFHKTVTPEPRPAAR